MADKPGSMYREISKPAYTRKEYITGIPGSKIAQHRMGDRNKNADEWPIQISLVVEEEGQIRNGALEASRLAMNRHLLKSLGEGNYAATLRKFTHHVLRENKQATGAGADRVSLGMRASFGKPVGAAARVEANQPLVEVGVEPKDFAKAKTALRKASYKFPLPGRIQVRLGAELLK